MTDVNVVVMDGPGPFYFGRLEGPIDLVEPGYTNAVAIRGEIEADETGRRVSVVIPLGDEEAMQLLRLLQRHQRARGLKLPD
jgi:hypothetical protein